MDDRRGIASLRAKRGEENVTFNDVADHLEDHVRRHPGDAEALDRLASFLAGVEEVPHDHESGSPTVRDDRVRDVPA